MLVSSQMQSQPKTTKHRKVLAYLIGSLGDTLVAIPALRAVRRHYPDSEIVLLQNAQSDGVVVASDVIPAGLVDRYISYDAANKITTVFDLWSKIRAARFDIAVYLVLSERPTRSVLRDKWFFRSSGIRNLIGFHAFSGKELYPFDSSGRPAVTQHEALRKLERIERDGIVVSPVDDLKQPFFTFSDAERDSVQNWLAPLRKRPDSSLIAVAPGCKTRSNLWPSDNFVELCRNILERKDCEIVVVGGKAESDLGDKIVTEIGEGINAAGKFNVRASAVLLSLCDFYVGLDTGTTHLSYAVGTPTFGIFGERNNPGQWFPLGARNTVISHPVPCSGCRLFECPIPGHPCMSGISVQTVLDEFKLFMQQRTDAKNAQTAKVITV